MSTGKRSRYGSEKGGISSLWIHEFRIWRCSEDTSALERGVWIAPAYDEQWLHTVVKISHRKLVTRTLVLNQKKVFARVFLFTRLLSDTAGIRKWECSLT